MARFILSLLAVKEDFIPKKVTVLEYMGMTGLV